MTRTLIAAAVAALLAGPALAEGAADPQQLPGQVTTDAQGWSGPRAGNGSEPYAAYGAFTGRAAVQAYPSADPRRWQRATDLEAANLGR